MIEAQVLQELNLDHSSLKRLALPIKQALWYGGVPAMFKAGLSQQKLQKLQQEQNSGQPAQLQQNPTSSSSTLGETVEGIPGAATSDDGHSDAASSNGADAAAAGSYGPYFRRQHLFVAATMPSLTKGDVGTTLDKLFKNARKVSGTMLHQVSCKQATMFGLLLCWQLRTILDLKLQLCSARHEPLVVAAGLHHNLL